MEEVSKETIFIGIRNIVEKMDEDWDRTDDITWHTRLVQDLGFESIEIVVLGNAIEDLYQQALPFSHFFTEIGEREVQDIQIGELVDFVHPLLAKNAQVRL